MLLLLPEHNSAQKHFTAKDAKEREVTHEFCFPLRTLASFAVKK